MTKENVSLITFDYVITNLTKGIVISVKVDEMYKILNSLLVNCFWLRNEVGIG